jgi:hypothetical protein
MAFHFPLAPVVRRRGCLEEGAARELAQATRHLETLSRHLGKIRHETAARSWTITHSALLSTTGMELGQLARDIDKGDAKSTAAAPDGEDARARSRRVDAASLRRHVRRITERVLPHLGVLSFAELPPHVNVQTLVTVELSHAPQMV